jgi:hypothetical protein
MSKKNDFSWGDVFLGALAVGVTTAAVVSDSPQTVFVPRGTNIGFSNPGAAKEYAEKYLGGTQIVATSPLSIHMISETRTPGIYGDTVVRYYSDGSKETVTPGIFGETVRRTGRTGGYGGATATVVRSVAVPIDRQSRRPSTLDGGRVYQSLTDWEWR